MWKPMAESSEMLRLRALLGFYNDDNVTVTGLSRSLGEEKYTISRLLSSLEEEGLVDRSNNRHPKTDRRGNGSGGTVRRACRYDGELPFVQRGQANNVTNVSMVNEGFEHPAILSVTDGVGTIRLHATTLNARSAKTGAAMKGKVKSLKYFDTSTLTAEITSMRNGTTTSFLFRRNPSVSITFVPDFRRCCTAPCPSRSPRMSGRCICRKASRFFQFSFKQNTVREECGSAPLFYGESEHLFCYLH